MGAGGREVMGQPCRALEQVARSLAQEPGFSADGGNI